MNPLSAITQCLICDTTPVYFVWNDEGLTLDGATSIDIISSYGSKFDGEVFYSYICDDCLEIKINQNKIAYLGNYIIDEESIEQGE